MPLIFAIVNPLGLTNNDGVSALATSLRHNVVKTMAVVAPLVLHYLLKNRINTHGGYWRTRRDYLRGCDAVMHLAVSTAERRTLNK